MFGTPVPIFLRSLMAKYLFILLLGVTIGYGYGWSDALVHEKHIVDRTLERINKTARVRVNSETSTATGVLDASPP